MAAFRTLRNRFAHSKTLRAIPDFLKRLLWQAAKWLRPGRTGMNNTIAVNMTEAVACLTTTILCAVQHLTGDHDLPEEKIMFVFQKIIEKKILEAQKKGEFDDLPGSGEPISIEDDSHVPEDLRLTYKILKNANCVPPEVQLRKDIRKMEDMLEGMSDEKEKYRHIKRINFKIMQLNLMGKASPLLGDTEVYYNKVLEKTGKDKT